MLKLGSAVVWRLGSGRVLGKYSSAGATVFKTEKLDISSAVPEKNTNETIQEETMTEQKATGLVAAAFASLNAPEDTKMPEALKKPSLKSAKFSKPQIIDTQIAKASDINSLLMIAESPVISRRHALRIVSVLSDWSVSNRVKISDFEKDPRFLKLCRILARSPNAQAVSSLSRADDLSTVLGITGDDEAARLITNLSLPQMIKVMAALVAKGRRSTPLLRALAHNITRQAEPLDLKKSADLLYSMAALNFPDEILMDRICSDILDHLPKNEDKPAVVGSIVVSLGLLRYRHEGVLEAVVSWVNQHRECCRPQDLASTVVTLATLDYRPVGCEPLLKSALQLREEELSKASAWLDLVFALLVLEQVAPQHVVSVLAPDFVEKLYSGGELPIPVRRKLVALDCYAAMALPAYTGPRLSEEVSQGALAVYTKEKQLYVQSIMDTFKSLVSADNFMRRDCNSGMGFLFDGEFVLDAKCHPVPLEKAATDKSVFRIAVLGLDYHDLCRKTPRPLGVNCLYSRLLRLKGYQVLQIPYTEYNPRDKLVARVQYVERRLKELVQSATST